LAAVQKTFFGPFKVSIMLDSNGCNTTAATGVAKIVKAMDVRGQRVVVGAGTGPVGAGRRLLASEGAQVTLTSRTLNAKPRLNGEPAFWGKVEGQF
jgi:hypothetical protein